MSNPRNVLALGEKTFLLKGSPVTLVVRGEDAIYVIDPGHGGKRAKQLRQTIRDLGGLGVEVIITHYHSDHLAVTKKLEPDQIISTELDAPLVKNSYYRIILTFGYPFKSGDPLLPFDAPDTEVTKTIDPGETIGEIETVHLPGHTLGQIGVFTPEKIFYIADAAFGSKVLENYYIPYHLDFPQAVSTLYKMRNELVLDAARIVFGHGPLVDKKEAINLIDLNIRHHEKIYAEVVDTAPGRTVEETAYQLLKKAGKTVSPQLLMLTSGSVRSIVIKEYGVDVTERGLVVK